MIQPAKRFVLPPEWPLPYAGGGALLWRAIKAMWTRVRTGKPIIDTFTHVEIFMVVGVPFKAELISDGDVRLDDGWFHGREVLQNPRGGAWSCSHPFEVQWPWHIEVTGKGAWVEVEWEDECGHKSSMIWRSRPERTEAQLDALVEMVRRT